MKSYLVIGLGLFGAETARQLCSLGCEVLAMDIHSELVQKVANDVTHAVVAFFRRIPLRFLTKSWVIP